MLAPRLDLHFKKNPAITKVPDKIGPPNRGKELWADFIDCVEKSCLNKNYEFLKLEKKYPKVSFNGFLVNIKSGKISEF